MRKGDEYIAVYWYILQESGEMVAVKKFKDSEGKWKLLSSHIYHNVLKIDLAYFIAISTIFWKKLTFAGIFLNGLIFGKA